MNITKIQILAGIILLLSGSVFAKEIKYKVADIPKELRENARSIVRNEEIVLTAKSLSKAMVSVTYAITILNKNGLEDSYFKEFYDRFTKISGIRGLVFDENGEQIKKIPSYDILDYSAISGYSIYEDNRVKYIDPKVRIFPFTVEYSWEQSFDGLFSFPSWYPQPRFNLAVEKSSYKAVVAKSLTFRFVERNFAPKATITSDAENNIYLWEARNLKAKEWEPYSVSTQNIFPCLLTAPSDFEIEGFKGNLNTWENFGRFISTLNAGKNVLNEETKKFLNGLVAGAANDYEKVKRIYEYMQEKTRYVSIQIGMGGWQPFDASTVQRLSYGDCKALTNYMKTMLEAIGINANYCLVNAGENAPLMVREFPSAQFNHAFLCVPLAADTLWLECTSQRMPCGFLGDFTDDRDILLIDQDKSKVVRTKAYTLENNRATHTSQITIDENGKGSATIVNIYKGLKYNDILSTLLADDADKKRQISERFKFPAFQILNFKYSENKSVIPTLDETIHVDFENYLTLMGSRYFLRLNYSSGIAGVPYAMRSRISDVYIRRPSDEIDTIYYTLTVPLKLESLPKTVSIKTQFGEYQAKAEFVNNQICYTRRFQLYKGQYPAADYPAFVDFYDRITASDEMKCTLLKN